MAGKYLLKTMDPHAASLGAVYVHSVGTAIDDNAAVFCESRDNAETFSGKHYADYIRRKITHDGIAEACVINAQSNLRYIGPVSKLVIVKLYWFFGTRERIVNL